jgi:broad specificity phosphatase PhoE
VPSYFITHPEVIVDPNVPIEQWGLSPAGRRRARHLPQICGDRVRSVIASSEKKALETAAILADALGLEVQVDPSLGEMNRSSTGYLPPAEFESVVESFFAKPDQSVRGWERAMDAQERVTEAVRRHSAGSIGDVAFVAHGGVGALLLASLTAVPIDRAPDQPGLGSFFAFNADRWQISHGWRRIT